MAISTSTVRVCVLRKRPCNAGERRAIQARSHRRRARARSLLLALRLAFRGRILWRLTAANQRRLRRVRRLEWS